MLFYECKKCGNMVGYIKKGACTAVCCGEPMVEMVANSTDAAQEKHVPVVEYADGKVIVKVGEVNHPMIPEHFIGWVALETKKGAQRKEFAPGDEPCVEFALTADDEPVVAYAYCNLHGLWKKEF